MHTNRSQRWRDRRSRWVPAAGEIDARRLAVDVIDTHKVAGPFVRAHHYAASMPVTRLSVGLFADGAGGRPELVGVCVFSHPVNDASVPKNAGLKNPRTACDLGRLVVLDSQGGNAESFLVARAFRLLRREKPEILSVISYADPVRRIDADGRIFMPGHVGGLYAVMAARYVGRSSPRTDLILPDGRPVSSRALSKIRNAECGQRYAIDDLLSAGARPLRHGEDRGEWLADLQQSGFLRRRRHPGCHAYVFPLTRAARHAASRVPTRELAGWCRPRWDRTGEAAGTAIGDDEASHGCSRSISSRRSLRRERIRAGIDRGPELAGIAGVWSVGSQRRWQS